MIRSLMERIAPHDPDEPDDDSTFVERFHHAEGVRAENPNTLWANDAHATPYIEVMSSWQWTHWCLGPDVSWQHGGRKGRKFGYPSRLDIVLGLGPWGVSLSFTWNYPTRYR